MRQSKEKAPVFRAIPYTLYNTFSTNSNIHYTHAAFYHQYLFQACTQTLLLAYSSGWQIQQWNTTLN